MINNKIEDLLPKFFQSRIKIVVDGVVKIDGRLILFSMKGFNFSLMIKLNSGRVVKYLLPRPLVCSKYDNKIVCDYRYETLADGNKEILSMLKKIKVYEPSSYMGKVAEIVHCNINE